MTYEPIIPAGLHLGLSRGVSGAVTGHLFDADNALRGHAAWRYVPDRPPSRTGVVTWVALGLLLGVAATSVVMKAATHSGRSTARALDVGAAAVLIGDYPSAGAKWRWLISSEIDVAHPAC